MDLELVWLPQFELSLSDRQWQLLSKSVAEMMCTEDVQMDILPGVFQYQRPYLYLTLADKVKFKKFLQYALTFVGRDAFTFTLIEKSDTIVRLRTGVY